MQQRYVNGNEPAPALRLIMKNGVRLSNAQVEDFITLVEDNGGWPKGVPAARKAFEEQYEVRGRSWVKRQAQKGA